MSAITDLTRDWSRFVDTGLYTVPMAARLIAAQQNHLRSWVETYPNSKATPIVHRELPKVGGRTVLGFLDLIEAAFIRHFRVIGYTPQTIRKVADKLRSRHGVDHPFAMNKRFRADGRAIFEEVVDEDGERQLLNLMNDNFEIGPVVEPSLFQQVFYVEDIARAWTPLAAFPAVIIDPKIAFGKPVVTGRWVPTEVLFRDYRLVGNVEEVADEYGLTVDEANAGIGFELELDRRSLH